MNEITVWKDDRAVMAPTFEGMLKQAEILVKSGFLPKSIRSAPAALAIMQAGREMGMPPMLSFRSLYFINGNITMSAQIISAKLLAAGVTYQIDELTEENCCLTFRRPNGMVQTHRFSIEDAKRAKLTGKDNWLKFPRDMLFNRCLASGGRKIAPDVLAGFYTPDELGGVENPETGEIIDSTARVIEPPAQEAPPPLTAEAKPKPTEEPKQAPANGAAIERTKVAFARYFYQLWRALFPEEKDRSLAHAEFRCQSIKELETGDNKAAARYSPILNLIKWGREQQLSDSELKKGLGIELWGDWEGPVDAGKARVEEWIRAQAEPAPKAESGQEETPL